MHTPFDGLSHAREVVLQKNLLPSVDKSNTTLDVSEERVFSLERDENMTDSLSVIRCRQVSDKKRG